MGTTLPTQRKTTTTVNLSAALALDGYRTLLVDMDKQRSATKLVCCNDLNGNHGYIGDALMKRAELSEIILETDTKNLYIAPSSQRLDDDNIKLMNIVFRENRLLNALKTIKNDYDFVLLDNPPDINTLSINTIMACNLVLIPCVPGRLSLEGLSDLFDTIEEIRGDEFKNILIFLNCYKGKSIETWSKDELAGYSDLIMDTQLGEYVAYGQAQILKTSLCEFDPKSKAAKNFKAFKEEFLSYVKDF